MDSFKIGDHGPPTISSEPFPDGAVQRTMMDDEAFPEGGRRAWSSLLGCFCAWMTAFGLMNTIGTFQAYLETHQLAQYTEAEIGWIFGLYLFMTYCCGLQWGPIMDAVGPKHLTATGSVCIVASMFLLEVCHRKCYRLASVLFLSALLQNVD